MNVVSRLLDYVAGARQRAARGVGALLFLAVFYAAIRWAVVPVVVVGVLVWLVTGNERIGDYVMRVGKGMDGTINAGLGGNHRETVSSRIGKVYYLHYLHPSYVEAPVWWMRLIRSATDRFESEHVFRAIEIGHPGDLITPDQKAEAIKLAELGVL